MLLEATALCALVRNGVISPVPPEHINGTSIDVTLGPTILREVEPPLGAGVVSLRNRESLTWEKVELTAGTSFVLGPGEFILAQTAERFDLPLFISAEFRLKSSAARLGLSHALAVWCDPGWHGSVLTMELHNISKHHGVLLQLGDRIGQMIFHSHADVPKSFSYAERGRYNNDLAATAAKK